MSATVTKMNHGATIVAKKNFSPVEDAKAMWKAIEGFGKNFDSMHYNLVLNKLDRKICGK